MLAEVQKIIGQKSKTERSIIKQQYFKRASINRGRTESRESMDPALFRLGSSSAHIDGRLTAYGVTQCKFNHFFSMKMYRNLSNSIGLIEVT